MNSIIRIALRQVILTADWDISANQKVEALDELVRLEREQAAKEANVGITGEQMRSFREFRKNNDRIPTIKMIRSVLNVGLAEALIIVKGIESHDGIV